VLKLKDINKTAKICLHGIQIIKLLDTLEVNRSKTDMQLSVTKCCHLVGGGAQKLRSHLMHNKSSGDMAC